MYEVVDKKEKPSKKRRNKDRRDDELVKPRKKFAKADRQEAENEIEEGYDKWCYGKNTKYGNVKRGPAIDLADGNNYMSGWERDFARFLTYLTDRKIVEGWDYEPQRFSFIGWYNSNPLFYVPDFVLKFSSNHLKTHKVLQDIMPDAGPEKVLYLEVKGQETGRDRNKWKRFRKCTGNTLNIVKRDEMKLIQSLFSDKIKNWESRIV